MSQNGRTHFGTLCMKGLVKYVSRLLFRFIYLGTRLSYKITRSIVIDISPLTVLICNCKLADLYMPAVKRYQFQYKVFVGLVWLTSNHMFGLGDLMDKSLSWFLTILKMSLFYSGNFKTFKNAPGQFIPNCPLKHVITCTNCLEAQNYIFIKAFPW